MCDSETKHTCCKSKRGKRGKHGKRGHRGSKGRKGPTGPTGPSGQEGVSVVIADELTYSQDNSVEVNTSSLQSIMTDPPLVLDVKTNSLIQYIIDGESKVATDVSFRYKIGPDQSAVLGPFFVPAGGWEFNGNVGMTDPPSTAVFSSVMFGNGSPTPVQNGTFALTVTPGNNVVDVEALASSSGTTIGIILITGYS